MSGSNSNYRDRESGAENREVSEADVLLEKVEKAHLIVGVYKDEVQDFIRDNGLDNPANLSLHPLWEKWVKKCEAEEEFLRNNSVDIAGKYVAEAYKRKELDSKYTKTRAELDIKELEVSHLRTHLLMWKAGLEEELANGKVGAETTMSNKHVIDVIDHILSDDFNVFTHGSTPATRRDSADGAGGKRNADNTDSDNSADNAGK